MYPDLELVDGDYMVVESFKIMDFKHDDIDVAKLDDMITKAEEEYGPHSLSTGSDRHRRFNWCTKIKISAEGRQSCDRSFPHLVIGNTGRVFTTPVYKNKRN